MTVKRGFPGLPCLYCGESDCVNVDLSEVTGNDAFRCSQCDMDFSVADVRARIDAWDHVISWITLAPVIDAWDRVISWITLAPTIEEK